MEEFKGYVLILGEDKWWSIIDVIVEDDGVKEEFTVARRATLAECKALIYEWTK